MHAGLRDPDRRLGATELARALEGFVAPDVAIIGLPAGGVAVAAMIARQLGAPLDVCVVRKLRAPTDDLALGFGAIAEGGELVLDPPAAARTGLGETQVARLIAEKDVEVRELVRRLRRGRPPIDLAGKTVIVVDDGAATGNTARAALRSVKRRGARRVVLAVVVAAQSTIEELAFEADEIVCLHAEPNAHAANRSWQRFARVPEVEIAELLGAPTDEPSELRMRALRGPVRIRTDEVALEGDLVVPIGARGIVLFAHEEGRQSGQHHVLTRAFERTGLATLVLDLLTPRERHLGKTPAGRLAFGLDMLAGRLSAATQWTRDQPETSPLAIGYFGSSTGAAAALIAAADPINGVRAVATRSGRPDLANVALAAVRAPTLLLVGERDPALLELNRRALVLLKCTKRLSVVSGATHGFDEPGALEQVARRSANWFSRHLMAGREKGRHRAA